MINESAANTAIFFRKFDNSHPMSIMPSGGTSVGVKADVGLKKPKNILKTKSKVRVSNKSAK